jgi:hypothetical protein
VSSELRNQAIPTGGTLRAAVNQTERTHPGSSMLLVVNPARQRHQIDHDLVGDSDDRVLTDIGVRHLRRCPILEDAQTLLHAGDIVWRGIDEQVDVFGRASTAMCDDGKASDQEVPCPGLVQ